jgi:hypothetical protein
MVSLLPGYKSKINHNILAILLLLWIIFQSTLALNGWYMNYRTPLPHWLFPYLSCVLLLFLAWRKPFEFEYSLQTLLAHLLAACRIGIAINLWQLLSAAQLSRTIFSVAIYIDIIWGSAALLQAFPAIRKMLGSHLKKWWHYAGALSVFALMTVAWFTAPGTWQALSFERPNYAFMHFPFIWLATIVWPACAWAHLILAKKPILPVFSRQ